MIEADVSSLLLVHIDAMEHRLQARIVGQTTHLDSVLGSIGPVFLELVSPLIQLSHLDRSHILDVDLGKDRGHGDRGNGYPK